MTDNDVIFTSQMIQALYRQKNINHVTTPVSHSTTNGQVERIHSTVLEIANSIAKQNATDTVDEIFYAVTQYNNTIHSVTKFRPNEVFFNNTNVDFNVVIFICFYLIHSFSLTRALAQSSSLLFFS